MERSWSQLGDMAPDFTLTAQDKSKVTLIDLRGERVILAFYPAAFTGVCTTEMCTFSDGMASLDAQRQSRSSEFQ